LLFNSVQFWHFFVVVYLLYLVLNHRWQNRALLVASYFFYGCWDWRFLSLIWISTCVDYFAGLRICAAQSPSRKKVFLTLSVVTNLGLLGFFKYFDFFAENLEALLHTVGLHTSPVMLNVVLPVGISFYTFQTMSYTIDVYRGQLKPTRNFLDFALFVAFFPQLVAGPIERASRLLPRIVHERRLDGAQIARSIYLLGWGLFKKVFVADNLAAIVDGAFGQSGTASGAELLIAVYAFAGQIYCDFSGYSDIARGLAGMMGIDIVVNFDMPYFARNPREFWRRWHISLSTWLRDYLYIPLGGNRRGAVRMHLNLMATMLLGGLWHGASWTFILWGFYHGALLSVHRVLEPYLHRVVRPSTHVGRTAVAVVSMLLMFHATCLGWLIFRAQSVSQMWEILARVVTDFAPATALPSLRSLALFAGILIVVQVLQYFKRDYFVLMKLPYAVQSMCYGLLFYLVVFYGGSTQAFIYFQF